MRLKITAVTITALLLSSPDLYAQRSSPFEPPPETDTTFITDAGSGLDTGCTYRSGGPLVITVEIDRYVGEVDGDGRLQDVDMLIANKVVSPKAKVRMPAFDIDINGGSGSTQPEHDRVFFNSVDLDRLTGDNNVWKYNEFEVDIRDVKFPSRGSDGTKPSPAENEIKINIDESNTSESWCMAIDWVEITFDTIAPILLVHGTDAQSDSWEPVFTDALDDLLIPYSNDINMNDNGGSEENARILKGRVNSLAKSFGAESVHLISHSKGGLDSRRFFAAHYQPNPPDGEPEVLSLTSIDTPHHGTILSDISVAHRTINDLDSNDPDIENFLDVDALLSLSGQGPTGAALTQQTTTNMVGFNAANPFPGKINFYTIGADADIDNDGAITAAEAAPLVPIQAARNGTIMYRILGNVSSFTVTRNTSLLGLNEYHTLTPINTTTFRQNDLVVTEQSAQHGSGTRILFGNDNHSSIKSRPTLQVILNRLAADFPLQ